MAMVLEPITPFLRDLNRYFGSGATAGAFLPAADVLVSDEDVTVHLDVPGVSRDNLEIELENDVLTVRGERPYPYEREDGGRAWQRIERGFGRFERDLRVPKGLDPDKVEASLVDGVLTLRIPKPEPLKPRRIEIRGGEARELEGAPSDAGFPGPPPAAVGPPIPHRLLPMRLARNPPPGP
jgi:HSP20 family protein